MSQWKLNITTKLQATFICFPFSLDPYFTLKTAGQNFISACKSNYVFSLNSDSISTSAGCWEELQFFCSWWEELQLLCRVVGGAAAPLRTFLCHHQSTLDPSSWITWTWIPFHKKKKCTRWEHVTHPNSSATICGNRSPIHQKRHFPALLLLFPYATRAFVSLFKERIGGKTGKNSDPCFAPSYTFRRKSVTEEKPEMGFHSFKLSPSLIYIILHNLALRLQGLLCHWELIFAPAQIS